MSQQRLHRLLPLSGVLFTAVLASGLFLTRNEPGDGASRSDIYTYWHGHHGVQMASSLVLIPLAVVFLVVFGAELRRAVGSPAAAAGSIIAAVGLGVTGSLGAAVATAARHGAHDSTYTLAQLQSYDWVPWIVGFAVMLLATGVAGLQTQALPKAVTIPAVVLGIAFLTPLGFFGLFLLPVWTLVTSVVLYRHQAPSRGPLASTAVQAA